MPNEARKTLRKIPLNAGRSGFEPQYSHIPAKALTVRTRALQNTGKILFVLNFPECGAFAMPIIKR